MTKEIIDAKPSGWFFAKWASILAVNFAIAAMLVTLHISLSSRVNSANDRIDTLHVMFYDLLKETKK